jgi:cysteine-rich repeat protein
VAVCGNGVLEPGEQCDDGNLFDLDGCDSQCKYEVVGRLGAITISNTAGPAFCVHTGNALGTKALQALAVNQFNSSLMTSINGGVLNALTQFLGLSDLTGKNATGFSIGIVDGTIDPAKGAWPAGPAPEDWHFFADPAGINMGLPTSQLTNAVSTNGAITAGPNTVQLTLNLGQGPVPLTLNNAKISGTVTTASVPGDLPANLKLQAGLMVLDGVTATGNGQGLCGDVTVGSLSKVPAPMMLVGGLCTQGYTATNSLLDVLVSGCTTILGAVVSPTQPDVAGNGMAVTPLTAGAGHVVTVPPGDNDAYSSYLQFTALRQHFTGESCTSVAQCQTGQSCTGMVCTPQ